MVGSGSSNLKVVIIPGHVFTCSSCPVSRFTTLCLFGFRSEYCWTGTLHSRFFGAHSSFKVCCSWFLSNIKLMNPWKERNRNQKKMKEEEEEKKITGSQG